MNGCTETIVTNNKFGRVGILYIYIESDSQGA